jgi:hypothetical protein
MVPRSDYPAGGVERRRGRRVSGAVHRPAIGRRVASSMAVRRVGIKLRSCTVGAQFGLEAVRTPVAAFGLRLAAI